MQAPKKETPVIQNKRARHNYEIIETLEAGIVLVGTEVKSLRAGKGEIIDAHVVPKEGELYLINLRIAPYSMGGSYNHEETRSRKLLLHRREIPRLISRLREKQLTLIPLRIYFNDRGRVKVLLGLGRGKKHADRRQEEKKAEVKREMERALRSRNR